MNNPLRYQITEYDCGPTSVLNRLIEPRVFAMESWGTDADFYACGPNEQREALVLFNEHTVLTAERTVEYII